MTITMTLLQEDQSSTMAFFDCMSIEKLQAWKAQYERLLRIEADTEVVITKKTGKPIKFSKMPWMVPAWTKGLGLVNQGIEHKTPAAGMRPYAI